MEKFTLPQRIDIAKQQFPNGCIVCNMSIGSVGKVSGDPFGDVKSQKVFLHVTYESATYPEDIDSLVAISRNRSESTRLNSSHMSESRMPSSA